MDNEKMSNWQKFKNWTSKSFGCTSSYTIKNTDPPYVVKEISDAKNVRTCSSKRIPSSPDYDCNEKRSPEVKQTDTNNNKQSAINNEPQQSFSKDANEIPYIDESMINIPQAVMQSSDQ